MNRALDHAIAEVYEGASSGRFFDLLPDIVARGAGARSCVVQKTDRNLVPTAIAHSWFTSEMAQFYLDERMFLDDVWANCAVEHGIFDRTIDIGELTGQQRYERSRFFQDFIRRFGDDTGHCLGALLKRPGGGFLTFGTHKAAGDAAFDRDDVRMLNLLAPHFLRAAAIDEELQGSRQEAERMRSVLDQLERPVITVGPAQKVAFANAAAETIVARGDGLAITAGRLTAHSASARQRLEHAIASALTHSGQQGGNVLVERCGMRPYRLVVAPVTSAGVTHAMILIDDPDAIASGAPRRLRELYDFTTAEADVAIHIAQGYSAEEIADRRGVGLATVKTLLQRCFRKSDTNRAIQLARLVNSLPA